MKDYLNFEASDFLDDDQFVKWARHAGLYPELDQFWKAWLDKNPHKREEVEEACRMIAAISEEGEDVIIEGRQEAVWKRLRTSTADHDELQPRFGKRGLTMVGATLLIVALSGAWFFFQYNAASNTASPTVTNEAFIKEVNNSESPKRIMLGDGSAIVLEPLSTLEYPAKFGSHSRDVVLTGEGFFEVSRDTKRPFLVHTDNVLTKVLGTSFSIRSFAHESNIVVKVQTGKVSVAAVPDGQRSGGNTVASEVLLAANQQATYAREEARLVKSIVQDPQLLSNFTHESFNYRDTPVKTVFATLENAYGVQIVYDEELMGGCLLNGSFGNIPLFDVLRLICKSVNAQYQIVDAHIVVTGQGCSN